MGSRPAFARLRPKPHWLLEARAKEAKVKAALSKSK